MSELCPRCAETTDAGSRYCSHCGLQLEQTDDGPPGGGRRPSALPEPVPAVQATAKRPRPTAGGGDIAAVGWGGRASSPPEGQVAAAAGLVKPLAEPVRGRRTVGYVRGLNQRGGPAGKQAVSFRVESFDEQGDRLPPVTVELRGEAFEGSLNEGDQVEIDKRPRRGRTLHVGHVLNHTAGSTFRIKKPALPVRIIQFPFVLVGYLIAVLVVGGFLWLLVAVLAQIFGW